MEEERMESVRRRLQEASERGPVAQEKEKGIER